MTSSGNKILSPGFIAFLLIYAASSLVHHIHNAEFLLEYPNLPNWLTRSGVYLAWLLTTLVGIVGYRLIEKHRARSGLSVLMIYGFLGLYGLAHYAVAPMQAHSTPMNLSIGIEVVTASLLLVATGLKLRAFGQSQQKG